MSVISWSVLLSAIFNLVLTILLGKRFGLFIFVVSSWWFLWLFISTFSLSGLDIPENNTYYLFITMLSSITFGGFVYLLTKSAKKVNNNPNKKLSLSSKTQSSKYSWLSKIYLANYLLAFPVTGFFFLKAIRVFISDPLALSSGYRTEVFQGDILFGSQQIQLIYDLIISPIALTSVFLGVSLYILTGELKLFLISSLILSMDAIMMAGRFKIYLIIVLLVTSFFYKKHLSILSVFRTKVDDKKIIWLLGFATILMISISILRSSSDFDPLALMERYVIDYHTGGFSLFDQDLNDQRSLLNQDNAYGISSLGSLERLVVLFLRRFDTSIDSSSTEIGLALSEFRIVGSRNGGKIILNAYGTVLYSIYRDGGLIATLILPSIYGFFLAKFSFITSKHPSIYNISIILILGYLGIFGIFTPLLTSNYWLCLMYINMFVPSVQKDMEKISP